MNSIKTLIFSIINIVFLLLATLVAVASGYVCDSYPGGSCGQPLHFSWRGVNYRSPLNGFDLVPFMFDVVFFTVIFIALKMLVPKNKPFKLLLATILTILTSVLLVTASFFIIVFIVGLILASQASSAGFAGVAIIMLIGYALSIVLGPFLFLLISPFVLKLFYKGIKFVSLNRIRFFPTLIIGEIIGAGIGVWVASGVVDPIFHKGEYSFSAFFLTTILVFIPFGINVLEKIQGDFAMEQIKQS